MRSEMMLRVLETVHERLVSSDEVSQDSLDSLEPGLAEALEDNLPVSIRGRFRFGPRLTAAGCTPGCGMAATRPGCP